MSPANLQARHVIVLREVIASMCLVTVAGKTPHSDRYPTVVGC
jgi:hypothetical protein